MSDHRALLKHSNNYLFANLATKALAFVSIPAYTYLLSIQDYGIVGVFMSLLGISTVLFTLNSEVAVSRYFYDAEDIEDFKQFVGSTILISGIILCITIPIFIIFLPFFSKLVNLSSNLIIWLLPISLYQISINLFTQIYNPLLKSKKIAIVSSIQAYLAFGLSIGCIILLPKEKYFGYIWGNILAMLILFLYIYKQIKPYCVFKPKLHYFKYILNYCLPYLPYSLSGVILTQFSRIFMADEDGYTLVGSYTLITNIAGLMMIVIGVTHSAWNPFYFKYMNNNDKVSIDSDYSLIWKLTLLVAFGITVFGKFLALILSRGGDYLETLNALPILIIGYIFYQWAYVYLRNVGYKKENIWNAVCVLLSGILNIFLNTILVPKFNALGAALATSLSFIFLMIISWIINKIIIRLYTPIIKQFLNPLIIFLIFDIFFYIISRIEISLVYDFLIKSIVFISLGYVFFFKYKNKILSLIKNKIK